MRKNLLVWVAAGILAVSAGGALIACGGSGSGSSPRPTASQLQEGFNILDASNPAVGMSAAYVKAGRVVYVETRVGALKPDVYRQAYPNDPAHEMDLRFVDQNGYTFYVQRGGDFYADPSWEKDVEIARAQAVKVSPADRALDFQLAQEAAKAAGTALPASFGDHIHHLVNFAHQPLPSQDLQLAAHESTIAKTPAPTDKAYSLPYPSFNYSGYSWLETDRYQGEVACVFWTCAYHSATIMWDCEWNAASNSCSWNLAINACNHGRCFNEGGMSYQCYSNGGWYANATISGETGSDQNGGGAGETNGGCATGYNWDTPPGHECDDDAAYELWQAKANTGTTQAWDGTLGQAINVASTPQGDANNFNWVDSNGHNYACNCSASSNGCDGDWQGPACP